MQSLRKAAILVASLSAREADALLDQMSPRQAALVRNAVLSLGAVDPAEEQRVIAEFLGGRTGGGDADAGVELEPALAARFGDGSPAAEEAAGGTPRADATPNPRGAAFPFLRNATGEQLAAILRGEHAQTCAVVLAHAAPELAAEALGALPGDRQTEILLRLARLEEIDPESMHEVERELAARLAPASQFASAARVEAVLARAAPARRQQWLAGLAARSPELARQLRPRSAAVAEPVASAGGKTIPLRPRSESSSNTAARGAIATTRRDAAASEPGDKPASRPRPALEFDALIELADADLALVLQTAPPQVAMLAVTGASPEFVARVLGLLPARDAKRLRHEMEHIGPLRLRDVEAAQQRVAQLAAGLAREGKIARVATRLAAA